MLIVLLIACILIFSRGMNRFIILVIQLHFLSYAWADTIPMVKRDLFPEWLIYQDKHYSPYKNLQGDKINIIHIRLPQSL